MTWTISLRVNIIGSMKLDYKDYQDNLIENVNQFNCELELNTY